MYNISDFEHTLLTRLVAHYPGVEQHIPFLRVVNREITGVGMYVNMVYVDTNETIPSIGIMEGAISSNERIMIPGLDYGLGYEVDVTNGRLTFIELFTYGEEWDGRLENYSFIEDD